MLLLWAENACAEKLNMTNEVIKINGAKPINAKIIGCYFHGHAKRKIPLINIVNNKLFMKNLFITDIRYVKYLTPVIRMVDKYEKLEKIKFELQTTVRDIVSIFKEIIK